MSDMTQRAGSPSIVLSVLMIAAGVFAIAVPQLAGVAVTAVVGWLLVFSGIMHLALAWRSATRTSAISEVLLGIVYGVIGFYLVTHPLLGLASLTLALAVYLFIEAALEFGLASHLRSMGGGTWLFIDAAVTLLLALMIGATWPFSSTWALGTLVGVSMLFSGISRLMLARALRRLAG